jgi:hypothetical protein
MSDPAAAMPTFLCNLRHDPRSTQFIASVSIVHPIMTGFSGVIRRFNRLEDVISALEAAKIAPNRYSDAVSAVRDGQCHSFEIDLNEAQKLDILQTDTSE